MNFLFTEPLALPFLNILQMAGFPALNQNAEKWGDLIHTQLRERGMMVQPIVVVFVV